MASSQQILREYLISLGYKVDATSQKRFDVALVRTNFNVLGLTKSVVGAMTAAQTFVGVWARLMEKTYYASKLAESSVSSLNAYKFAASTIGVSSEQMESSIIGMARAMRLNPGLQGLVESFGIPVRGRDMADVARDFVRSLKALPFYQAAQFANLFGMDPDTLLLLIQGTEKLDEMVELRKQMVQQAGLDEDAAAKAAVEYQNQVREVTELFNILQKSAAIALLPMFKEVAGVVKEILWDWIRIMNSKAPDDSFGGIMQRLGEHFGLTEGLGGGVELTEEAKARLRRGALSRSRRGQSGDDAAWEATAGAGDKQAWLEYLESTRGLPSGMLDRQWSAESDRGRGPFKSSAGAEGDFQFMPKTARQRGVDTHSFQSSSAGAADYMQELLARYGGNAQLAAGAYNWGMGNIDRKGLGPGSPRETLDYVNKVTGQPVTFQQSNTYSVTTPDPETAARLISGKQAAVTSDAIRNLKGAVQ